MQRVGAQPGLASLVGLLHDGAERVRLFGGEDSFRALAITQLTAAHDRLGADRPLIVITPNDAIASNLARDLQFFMHAHHTAEVPRVLHLPHLETAPWADVAPDRRAIARRMATLFRLSQGLAGEVLVASAPSLARRVIPREIYASLVDVVQAGEEVDRDGTIDLLVRGGYSRLPVVEDPGSFAVRGGVIDVFVPLYRFPLRLELDGDRVESLRFFDPETQRTLRAVDEIFIHPVRETILTRGHQFRERLLEAGDHASHPSSKTRAILDQMEKNEDFFGIEALTPAFHARMASLAEYLPEKSLLFVEDPDACLRAVEEELSEGEESYRTRIEEHRLAFPPQDFFLSTDEVRVLLRRGRRVEVPQLDLDDDRTPAVRVAVETHRELRMELERARAEKHEELLRPLVTMLRDFRDEGVRAILVSPNLQHAERLDALLRGYQITSLIHREPVEPNLFDATAQRVLPEILVGHLGHGFRLPLDGVALISESEIFGERAMRKPPKAKKALRPDGLKHLQPGSFVVHSLHGVGLYQGLTKLPLKTVQGAREVAVDFLHLEYEGGALYLPVWRLNEVQAYSGAEGIQPRLDRLGGATWEKTKAKVSKEVRQLAEELLQLYAQRQALPGHSYSLAASTEMMFREFEGTFPFEETPDQQKAIDDVLDDLDQARPMDRLVCGDVGYGKTEVALRAALKVVLGGKQVAILAPTTVLVEQHALTFAARYAGLPVNVASISRFKSKGEQLEVLKGLSDGKIDVVVGTHRLLSPDVRMKELGLVVIDEEQRFGVAHKEKLKKLRTQVDVLTMSATPIPRTLHMALMGIREISIITTPPADRLAIRTLVCRYSDALVVEGVKRELARGGQIFFVHNRVEDIRKWEEKLKELLPEVRILVGHGQMPSEDLEKVMVDFVDGRADVLLCTTIIESGLDIPRANTMFVNRADRFGLAQLYQLRGRIGRSRERAFCYLLIPKDEELEKPPEEQIVDAEEMRKKPKKKPGAITDEARQRLQVLQKFTELGAGFQIASHDLEIRGAGDLLGAKQSGAIAAVGFDTYTQILEEAVATLRGEPIHHERDPELTCDLPGFIPDDYCPDVGQRLEFYRRLSSARDEGEIRESMIELQDRFGPPPPEAEVLADIMVVKSLGRRLGARAIELNESRFALALGDDTPLQPAQVMKLVQARNSPWKLTPDMRLQRNFVRGETEKRLEVAKKLLADLLAQAPSS